MYQQICCNSYPVKDIKGTKGINTKNLIKCHGFYSPKQHLKTCCCCSNDSHKPDFFYSVLGLDTQLILEKLF